MKHLLLLFLLPLAACLLSACGSSEDRRLPTFQHLIRTDSDVGGIFKATVETAEAKCRDQAVFTYTDAEGATVDVRHYLDKQKWVATNINKDAKNYILWLAGTKDNQLRLIADWRVGSDSSPGELRLCLADY